MTPDRPGVTLNDVWNLFAPSKLTNAAVTSVVAVPRFWMMNGTSQPKNRLVTFGRKTFVAPVEKPE